MLTQLYYADFTQMIYAIHYALYAFITQIIYADFTQIIYAIHYAVYAIHLRKYIYAITIISLRRLRKYRFSLRKFTQRATCWCDHSFPVQVFDHYIPSAKWGVHIHAYSAYEILDCIYCIFVHICAYNLHIFACFAMYRGLAYCCIFVHIFCIFFAYLCIFVHISQLHIYAYFCHILAYLNIYLAYG